MNLPIYISYFYCRFCDNDWGVVRDKPQFKSKCQDCEKSKRSYYRKTINDRYSNFRCFGYFECDCGNFWGSAYTWILYSQKCVYCRRKVFPSSLYQLRQKYDGGNGDRDKGKHWKYFCAKCIEVGDCIWYDYQEI